MLLLLRRLSWTAHFLLKPGIKLPDCIRRRSVGSLAAHHFLLPFLKLNLDLNSILYKKRSFYYSKLPHRAEIERYSRRGGSAPLTNAVLCSSFPSECCYYFDSYYN